MHFKAKPNRLRYNFASLCVFSRHTSPRGASINGKHGHMAADRWQLIEPNWLPAYWEKTDVCEWKPPEIIFIHNLAELNADAEDYSNSLWRQWLRQQGRHLKKRLRKTLQKMVKVKRLEWQPERAQVGLHRGCCRERVKVPCIKKVRYEHRWNEMNNLFKNLIHLKMYRTNVTRWEWWMFRALFNTHASEKASQGTFTQDMM